MHFPSTLALIILGLTYCSSPKSDKQEFLAHPTDSHHHSNYVHQLHELNKVNAGNGEKVYHMEGKDYNLEGMSIAVTETQPGGGPPLHYHESSEAHIIMNGQVTYVIGDSTFTVKGPFVANVPAGVKHTFINSGDSTLNLIAIFPQDSFGQYNELGINPLINATD